MQKQSGLAIGDDLSELGCSEAPVQGHENVAGALAGETHGDLFDRIAPEKGNALRCRQTACKLGDQRGSAADRFIQRCIGLGAARRDFVDRLALGADHGAIDQRIIRLQSDGSHFHRHRLEFRLHIHPPIATHKGLLGELYVEHTNYALRI